MTVSTRRALTRPLSFFPGTGRGLAFGPAGEPWRAGAERLATLVTDPAEKLAVMKGLIDHVAPGRWDHIRQPNEKELAATSVLSIQIVEASAKLRSGDPLDDDADYAMPIWAGQIPFATSTLPPVADTRLDRSTPIPPHVAEYRLPVNRGARVT